MEAILKDIRAYNLERQIWPSENRIIDILLKRTIEMKPVFEELSGKLTDYQQKHLWDALLGAAAFWNPDASKDLRDKKRQLEKFNVDIAKTAKKLATLLQRRREICEENAISAYEDYHFLHWVHRAGESNHLYVGYVKGSLEALSGQFDLKYWPENEEIVAAIGTIAEESDIYENDSWTRELLSSPKQSRADYVRVILKAIEDRKRHGPTHYQLPRDFRLSDHALATLVNCTLDLMPEDLVSSENIKRSRQNIRKRKLAE